MGAGMPVFVCLLGDILTICKSLTVTSVGYCHVPTLVLLLCLCFKYGQGVSWVGCLCSFFYDLGFLCLAWYGSQSEAAVNRYP